MSQSLKSQTLTKEIITCIHPGEKTLIKIKYLGNPKTLQACSDCENIIKSSSICEVLV